MVDFVLFRWVVEHEAGGKFAGKFAFETLDDAKQWASGYDADTVTIRRLQPDEARAYSEMYQEERGCE